MVKLLHFSDVHLTVPTLHWRTRDVLSKKAIGWVNIHWLGRGHRFRHARTVAAAMMADAVEAKHDGLIFTGDATKLAFEPEFEYAAKILRCGDTLLPPGVAIPGNHDYYTKRDVRSGKFERHFGPWLDGLRADESHRYPFARKFGHVWIIALNSSNPRRLNTTASATAGEDQLERLRMLCTKLDAGPRVIATHYPLRNGTGRVERRSHRLIDHRAALAAAAECGVGLWLHGHIHKPFTLPPSEEIPFPLICVGSATQTHRWSHNIYTLDGYGLTMQRRTWNHTAQKFDDAEQQQFTLRPESETGQ